VSMPNDTLPLNLGMEEVSEVQLGNMAYFMLVVSRWNGMFVYDSKGYGYR